MFKIKFYMSIKEFIQRFEEKLSKGQDQSVNSRRGKMHWGQLWQFLVGICIPSGKNLVVL